MDDFEQKLQRQPLRQIPGEWREEILATAESAVGAPKRSEGGLNPISWWRRLLWPHPQAWAGLAAIWIVILAVDFSLRDKTPAVAGKSLPPSPEVIVELRQQQRMLAELIGPRDTSDADRSKSFVPQPRSERAELMTT